MTQAPVSFESKLRKPTTTPVQSRIQSSIPKQACVSLDQSITEIAACEEPTTSIPAHRRSSSYQTSLGRSLGGKKKCECRSKHELELRHADEVVQRCHRMLREVIKLKTDLHGHFYLMDMLARTHNGPRVTQELDNPSATLQESLSQLDTFIRDKVGKAFLKRAKKQTEADCNATQEDKKARKSRKSRQATRSTFEGESSITLDMSEFSKPEHSRQIESMLKDYVASMKAVDEITLKIK